MGLLEGVQSDDTEKGGTVEINAAPDARTAATSPHRAAHSQLCYVLVLCSWCQLAFNCQRIWAMEFLPETSVRFVF